MSQVPESTQPAVGSFDLEVYSSGRGRRSCSSRFKLRCDAIALHEKEILLLSVVGSETSVKALTAGLRSSGKDQKRIDYTVHLGTVNETNLTKCPDGYRVYRTKLEYGLWHVLCLAKREGFLSVVSDETLWQHLQSHRFTTPLIREWVPWLCKEMTKKGVIAPLTQGGCQAGLMLADSDILDDLVGNGTRKGHLVINGQGGVNVSTNGTLPSKEIKTLEEYLLAYGPLLGQQAERSLQPLHVPGQHPLPILDLMRKPFEAQQHVIEATRQALRRQKSILLVGEMGTGKTIMGMSAIHGHAAGQPYRALVFCPGQLVNKWEREIRETIPGAEVIQIESWKTLLPLKRAKKPSGVEWYIIARDRAKLGAKWKPSFQQRTHLVDGVRTPRRGKVREHDRQLPCPPSCGVELGSEREVIGGGPEFQEAKAGETAQEAEGPGTDRGGVQEILEVVAEVVGPKRAASWQHLYEGLWWSGLRLGEALELWWDRDDKLCIDLTQGRPLLRIPAELEKGHQDRLLPIAPEFANFLLKTTPEERTGRVFKPEAERERSEALTIVRIIKVMAIIGKKSGVVVGVNQKGRKKYASAHDFRRAFGDRWALRVMPPVLMQLMRHESIETTMRYYVGRSVQATADVVWEAYERTIGQSGNEIRDTLRDTNGFSEKGPEGPVNAK